MAGSRQLKNKKLKYKLFSIFILPPSKKELLKRLIKRKKNMKTVQKRMKGFKKDLVKWKDYDYVVINDNLNICYKKIIDAIKIKIKHHLIEILLISTFEAYLTFLI